SCQKRKLNKDTSSSEDDALAESMFDDVFKVVDESAKDEGLDKMGGHPYTFSGSNACATITIDPPVGDSTWPKIMTIDFGTSGCTGSDGRTRKGKIVADISGKYRDEGTVTKITPENYYVDDNKIEGSKVVTNKGRNSSNNLWYTVEVNGTVTTVDGDEITWVSSREREWVEGEATTFWTDGINGILDDAYDITGNGSGVNRNGRAYSVEITKALHVQFCGWIPEVTSGTIELIPEDLKSRTVDFGDGDCDNQATATIGKRTYSFNLR
ncbi:MAG: hypothetical protein ACE5DN_05720, partial [Flavobacteriales bacterium]